MLQSVGVVAVPAVARPPARLHEGGVPGLGPQRAQRRRRVERSRADFKVIRLQDGAPLLAPVPLERHDDVLE